MKKILMIAGIMALLGLGVDGHAQAQEEGIVQLETTAEIEIEVVNDEGEKEIQRIAATRVVPGDEVIYTTTYFNTGEEPAGNIVITNPIPEHMLYTPGSAVGENAIIEFSIDGGQRYDLAENLRVPTPAGGEKLAEAGDYTHIRWALEQPLDPGAAGEVGFRAILQ